jgi:hypothetical protein
MPDDFEIKGRVRYRSVDVKTMKPAKLVTNSISNVIKFNTDKPCSVYVVEDED